MSKRPHSDLFDMEEDIRAVGRWAGVLSHLGSGDNAIQPSELHVIAMAIMDLGNRLEHDWTVALQATGGRQ